jgi:CDP-diacylglycerol---glycerol-3-phosphate 3-phosphatidyltransferase
VTTGDPNHVDRDAARVRDMPDPRDNPSAAGGAMKRMFTWPYKAILAGLYRIGVRPWQLTILSLALNVVVAVLLIRGERVLPGLLLIPAGMADVFDGGVARLRGEAGRSGAFMDSVLDRVADATLFAALYWSLARQGQSVDAALTLVTLVVTLLVSHLRAEAEAAGLTLSEGFFQRLERYLATIAGLTIPGALRPVLILLAALGGVTVLQRGWSATRRAAHPPP